MLSRRLTFAVPLLALPGLARAAVWPEDRPVEVIIPFPPSGGVDTMARLVLNHVAPRIPGFRYAVTNRPGAGGQIGFEATFNATPDGYTIGAVTNNAMHGHAIERRPRYRPEDFTFITNVTDDPGAFFVDSASPLKTLVDFQAAAQAAPETLGVGTAGIGTDDHLLMMGFEEVAGIRLVHVPYTGTAPQLRDLLGGRLPVGCFNMGEGINLMREGKIRCLGQAGEQRWSAAAEIPTFREQGFDCLGGSARGLAGPPGMPPEVVARLVAAFRDAMAEPAYVAETTKLGLPIRPLVGEEYRQMMAADYARLRALWQRRPWKEG
jgi:tripartite-type tricarboxylate transporter receptor subunit TctC